MSALHKAARRVVAAWTSTRPAWVQECNESVLALDAALKAQPEPAAWATEIIDALQAQYDTEMIQENDSGDALIRLDDAIAAVEDAEKHYTTPPKPEPEPAQEPVAYTTGHCKERAKPGGCQLHNLHCRYPRCDRKPALKSQPEPAQEPVGWNWMLDGQPYGQAYYGNPPDTDIAERAAIAGRTVRLLYTAPQPQRPPLTDEEISDIYIDWDITPGRRIADLVRAIERKLKGE